ncbi:MAG: type II toxin-antitoxin system RelE/ParE family toxin [Vicinamibacterales bacterium]
MRYRLSPLAEEDLREIWLYVADDTSESAADRLIDALIERFTLGGAASDGATPA